MNLLLWVDLEGVAGVDHIAALIGPSQEARALLAAELEVVCASFTRVFVVDTHLGEGPSVVTLPANAELVPGFDARADAVACLGMHAAEGGFVPHTMDLSCRWEVDGRPVSEAELWLGLAAERGLGVVFVSGDEALHVKAPFVPSKRALSPSRAVSRQVAEVHAALREAASRKPVPAPRLEGELSIRFRSAWMARCAVSRPVVDVHPAEASPPVQAPRFDAELEVVSRLVSQVAASSSTVRLEGATLEARIAHGEELLRRNGARLAQALRPWALVDDLAALAARPFPPSPPVSYAAQAQKALAAFLARTADGEQAAALRALTLHMLEAHAPAFFAARALEPVLEAAVSALKPGRFDAPEDAPLMMARLDALYVLRERGRAAPVDEAELGRCIAEVYRQDVIWGWLLGELAHQLGLPGRVAVEPRPFRESDRLTDLYWLTHLFLLETRYLRRPLPREGFEAMTEELLLAIPFVLERRELDLAAELAFCLAAAGEDRAPLLAALAQAQAADGSVGEGEPWLITHCTSAALLAFAATGL